MLRMTGLCRSVGIVIPLALVGCMLFEPPALSPPADDPCFAEVSPDQLPTTPSGDYPYSWVCEAKDRRSMSNALHWLRNSAEYRALAIDAYRRAESLLPELAQKHRATGWLVIMDVDETLLDNSDYTKECEACGLDFWQPTWCDWSRARRARAVPGAVAFTRAVRRQGGFIVVVSNRLQREEQWTKDNLAKLGIEVDLVYLRTDESDKTTRWRKAVDEIRRLAQSKAGALSPIAVMWVGDQISDFPRLDERGAIVGALSQSSSNDGHERGFGALGVRFILLPQPLYSAREGWLANPRE